MTTDERSARGAGAVNRSQDRERSAIALDNQKQAWHTFSQTITKFQMLIIASSKGVSSSQAIIWIKPPLPSGFEPHESLIATTYIVCRRISIVIQQKEKRTAYITISLRGIRALFFIWSMKSLNVIMGPAMYKGG
jgi:hypothetical protein